MTVLRKDIARIVQRYIVVGPQSDVLVEVEYGGLSDVFERNRLKHEWLSLVQE